MAHTHSSSERLSDTGPLPLVKPDDLRRHQRALRILIVVLIPLAIWTLVGLVAFWPGDISRQVNADVTGYSVPGVTYPTARITGIKEISCEGLAGSTPGVTDARCADLTSQLLEGDDKGKTVTVAVTAAIYSSGVKVGQVIKLVRVPPSGDQPAQYQFSDFKRTTPLLVMGLIFAAVVIVVARWRGFAALLANTRFLPMGFAIAPSMRGGRLRRLLRGALLADASFVIGHRGGGQFDISAIAWAAPVQYVAWIVGTVAGVAGATAIGDPSRWGLDVLFPVFYLSLLLPELFPERLKRGGRRTPPHSDHASSSVSRGASRNRRPIIVAALAAAITLALTPVAPAGVPVLVAAAAALIGLRPPRQPVTQAGVEDDA